MTTRTAAVINLSHPHYKPIRSMTPDDDPITTLSRRHSQALRKLVPLARAAARILKDAGHPSSAGEIDAVLFEIDSINGELLEIIRTNPDSFITALIRRVERE